MLNILKSNLHAISFKTASKRAFWIDNIDCLYILGKQTFWGTKSNQKGKSHEREF